MKEDLRNDKETIEKLKQDNQKPISHDKGFKLSQRLKAAKFCECSALTKQGLKNVFDEAIKVSFESAYTGRPFYQLMIPSCISPRY